MVINHTALEDFIWDWVYHKISFCPNGLDMGHDFPYGPPFRIPGEYAVYGIEHMTEDQIDLLYKWIPQIFTNVTKEGQRIFALDWQHSSFLIDPRNVDYDKSEWVSDARFPNGGYNAYLPGFYPDGDYFFFIAEDLSFGYLGHPWREEIWIFGDTLLDEIEKVQSELGWTRLQ